MSQNLFEEVLERGIQEKQREFKKEFIHSFKARLEALFEETKDVKLIHKNLLELCEDYELTFFNRRY